MSSESDAHYRLELTPDFGCVILAGLRRLERPWGKKMVSGGRGVRRVRYERRGGNDQIFNNREELYNSDFYESTQSAALESARVVVPLLFKLIQPSSVVDVGCGRGAWLSVFRENGVKRIRGIDGSHVDEATLLIDRDSFSAADLAKPFEIQGEGEYDLALCLEVGEHLISAAGKSLIRALTKAAPVVLFSAAIPGQGGTGHVNEQWPRYWQREFAEHGYVRLDPIRRQIWQDGRVQWFYRQNLLLYACAEAISSSASLQAERERSTIADLELIHVDILYSLPSLRDLVREIPAAARRSMRYRLSGWPSP